MRNGLQYYLDAANPDSYPRKGNTWYDISGLNNYSVSLFNSWGYGAGLAWTDYGGGSIAFNSAWGQYGYSAYNLNSPVWTVEAVGYYVTGSAPQQYSYGTNPYNYPEWAVDPAIITDVLNGGNVQYSLGCPTGTDSPPNIQTGFNNGSWYTTPDSSWGLSYVPTHTVGTYDGSTLKLYADGVLKKSQSITATPSAGGNGFFLMRRAGSVSTGETWKYMFGFLSVVRLYNRALSADELLQNYNAEYSRLHQWTSPDSI